MGESMERVMESLNRLERMVKAKLGTPMDPRAKAWVEDCLLVVNYVRELEREVETLRPFAVPLNEPELAGKKGAVPVGSRVLFTQASEFPGDEGIVERLPDDEIHYYGIQTFRNGYVEAAREDFVARVGN